MKENFQEGPLVFYLNGKRIEVKNPQPEQTLISFLRSNEIRLTGTKLGCGEGGCGACTVMISHYDAKLGKPVHRAINSCLALLGSVEGTHVTTVEGIGSTRDGLHPVQEKISTMHGSQCGFCTPGIIMALYAFLRENPHATAHEIEESLDGNLCRCTGYRPILDAAKTFASDKDVIAKGAVEDSKEKIAGELPPGARICPSSGKPCYCQVESSTETVLAASEPSAPKEFIFPPALIKHELKPICFKGDKSTWYRPLTLEGLLEIKHLHPEAKIVMGSSELTIEAKFKNARFPVLISPVAVPELNAIESKDNEIIVGSAVTLNNLRDYLREQIKRQPASRTKTLQAVVDQLRWFAGNQIRNGASVGGNIATASPISDLNPVWMAAGTNFTLASYCPNTNSIVTREVPAKKFFISYRRTEMKPNEVIKSINIPFNDDLEYVKAYKQARRREDDIAIVTCAFRVKFSKDHKVTEASFGYGGMAPITVSAKSTEEYLVGRVWNKETFEGSLAHLEKDLPLAPNAPGGMIQYRRSLTTSFFFKFFCQVADAIGTSFISEKEKSLLDPIERPLSRGEQKYYVDKAMLPVTAPLMHHSGKKQVTGEAIYIDDIKNPSSGLYSAFVLSTRAHARIVTINPEKALQMPGVKGFFSAKDIPADNDIGPVIHDEELFASKEVLFHNHPIGIVVAETHQQAVEASKAVEVVYDDLPAILTIKDAIAANSFFDEKPQIWRGENIDEALSKCEHFVSGEMDVGGQEHFYLETQTTFAEPVEGDEFVIHSSTQNPTKTQVIVSRILGIPQHYITVKTKRMGGGFGGKETRSVYVSAAAALAAYHMKQPVRLVLDRDVDMATSGARHAFHCKYRVGFASDGTIKALDAQLFSLGGYSMDLSASVLHRAMFHIDNAYFIPSLRVTGRICKTNTPTNTAFRGFGGPQGMMFAENYIDHVSKFLKIPASVIREKNYYTEGQLTHYGQPLNGVHLQRLQKEIFESANWEQRKQAVEKFNENNRWKKRGIAYVPVKFGMSFTAKFMNQAGALVHVYTDGSVLVSHGGTEMGQGLHIKMIQVAAHALGVPVNKVYVSETSTDKVPNSSPTAASASSDMYGMAVLDACNQIKKKLQELKERLGEKMTDHSFENLVRTAYFERIPLTATGFYATPNLDNYTFDGRPGTPFAYYTYGIAVSEVEIDVLSGDFQILRADVLMDIGNSLNPTIDVGQVEGAFVQGTGWCTIEEIVLLGNGVTFTRGPGTYKIPSFNDIPIDFRVSLLRDAPNPLAIHSSKGIGEPPLFLAASVFWAIKEAVYAARKETTGNLDYFQFNSPATCERIRLGCIDSFTNQFAPK